MQHAGGINKLHVEKHLPMLLGLRPPDLLSSTGLCIFSSGTVPFALGMTRRHPVHESLAKRGRYFVSLSFSRVIVNAKLVFSVACCFSSLLFSSLTWPISPRRAYAGNLLTGMGKVDVQGRVRVRHLQDDGEMEG